MAENEGVFLKVEVQERASQEKKRRVTADREEEKSSTGE